MLWLVPPPQIVLIWSTIPVFVVAVFSLVASKQNYVIGSFCMLREPSLCQFFSRPKKSINFQNILMVKRTPKIYRLYPLIHICMFFSPYKKVVQGLFVQTPREMGFFSASLNWKQWKKPHPHSCFCKSKAFHYYWVKKELGVVFFFQLASAQNIEKTPPPVGK